MLTSAADWRTESIRCDFIRDVQVLVVLGDYRACDPDALCRSIAANFCVSPEDVHAERELLIIVVPMGVLRCPADYRAWVDEGISEAERDTIALRETMRRSARIAADNIASLAFGTGLSTDAIMRAALVPSETATAITRGEALPAIDLVRIATALGVTVESLLSPEAR